MCECERYAMRTMQGLRCVCMLLHLPLRCFLPARELDPSCCIRSSHSIVGFRASLPGACTSVSAWVGTAERCREWVRGDHA